MCVHVHVLREKVKEGRAKHSTSGTSRGGGQPRRKAVHREGSSAAVRVVLLGTIWGPESTDGWAF